MHEAGDVAVRVTSEGLILVDDKFDNNVAEIMEKAKSVSSLPIKYLLNTQVFDHLKLADLGWDHTVSTETFKGGLEGYYEEMKAQPSR